MTTGLAQLDAFTRDLTDLLKEYERAGKGKFKVTLIEANPAQSTMGRTEHRHAAETVGKRAR